MDDDVELIRRVALRKHGVAGSLRRVHPTRFDAIRSSEPTRPDPIQPDDPIRPDPNPSIPYRPKCLASQIFLDLREEAVIQKPVHSVSPLARGHHDSHPRYHAPKKRLWLVDPMRRRAQRLRPKRGM